MRPSFAIPGATPAAVAVFSKEHHYIDYRERVQGICTTVECGERGIVACEVVGGAYVEILSGWSRNLSVAARSESGRCR